MSAWRQYPATLSSGKYLLLGDRLPTTASGGNRMVKFNGKPSGTAVMGQLQYICGKIVISIYQMFQSNAAHIATKE